MEFSERFVIVAICTVKHDLATSVTVNLDCLARGQQVHKIKMGMIHKRSTSTPPNSIIAPILICLISDIYHIIIY